MDREQLIGAMGRDEDDIVERNFLRPATATISQLGTSVIHENPPHHLRCDGKELRAVLPFRIGLSGQLDVCLVDQSSGLQCVTGALAAEASSGDSAQLVVDERNEFGGGVLVAGSS